jgi:hypothetical protein
MNITKRDVTTLMLVALNVVLFLRVTWGVW